MMKQSMMKHIAVLLGVLLTASLLTACGEEETSKPTEKQTESTEIKSSEAPSETESVPETYPEITGAFAIQTKVLNGYTQDGNTYVIKKEGSYSLSGVLQGQISIEAGKEEAVELILNGVSITATENAPIYAHSGKKLKLIVADGTYNEVIDARAKRPELDDDIEDEGEPAQGNGAIYVRMDLSMTGKGTISVTGGYNNGIHSTKDLTYENVNTMVTAANNAFKGNQSVTINSGKLSLTALGGDGIKTKRNGQSLKLVQRGIINISGGTIDVYAEHDGVTAAYDVVINGGTLNVYTADLVQDPNAVTKSVKNDYSSKGLKAVNRIEINDGKISIWSRDDAISARTSMPLETGATALGDVVINGGTIKAVTGGDGLHADGQIKVIGGQTDLYVGGKKTKAINAKADYLQSGGQVIARVSSNEERTTGPVEAVEGIRVTGGNLIALGGSGKTPTNSCNVAVDEKTVLT